ncbi:methyltransferase domain-containing protein [Actinomadura sp. HBU206391]|nr:methyltransferase domain-containing protein [Actinomadura sp. HBU206391]
MLARTIRGIEPLAAAEIGRIGVVRRIRHREVWFEVPDPGRVPEVLDLRTPDDVFVLAAVYDGIGRSKSSLLRLAQGVRETCLTDPPALPERGGGAAEVRGVDVSASFVGRRNYTRYDIEDAVGAELARAQDVVYHSRRDGAVPPCGTASWRVTVEGEQATLALRMADRPLHRRAYKRASVAGTLHPPLAAAMARLAGLEGVRNVLDPCCGAGTLLFEARAASAGPRLLGTDLDPAAVRVAKGNATGADRAAWAVADAGRIPLPARSVDRILVNPPWQRQVPAAGLLKGDQSILWRQLRRVLTDDGCAVALLHDPSTGLALAAAAGFRIRRTIEVSLFGAHPVIGVLNPAEAGLGGLRPTR